MTKDSKPANTFDVSTERMRSLTSASDLAIADRMVAIREQFIPLKRDEILARLMRNAMASLTASSVNKPNKKRIIAICGESGAGKSTSVAFHIARQDLLKPYRDEDGVLVNPVLVFDAPAPCTPRLLAIEGLLAMGIQVQETIRENEVWLRFRKMLRKHKIKFVVIDEVQNAIEFANSSQIGIIADALKQIVQQRDWPVHMMLAGVPPLGALIKRKHLLNRTSTLHFDPIDKGDETTQLDPIVTRIIEFHAGLAKDEDLNDDFLLRLAHACTNDLGTAIGMARDAVELVLYAGRTTVSLNDFADIYELTGCKKGENIFLSDRWRSITPETAPMREGDQDWVEEHQKSVKKIAKRGEVSE
ncbi:ATP-binding protein [Rhizobium laguerreae]|uniref:ATP-binding protein n=1 Tax=Rhizobium laguerreae TaxID=1076926 RepID=UPI001C90EEE0|nr:ATP-binding protein [Rhizobium laguerreae]MBY3328537.1 ATP-binding protein [Rhizobium laguerreae]